MFQFRGLELCLGVKLPRGDGTDVRLSVTSGSE